MAALEGEVPVNFKNDMRDGWIGMSKKRQKQVFLRNFRKRWQKQMWGLRYTTIQLHTHVMLRCFIF